MKQTKTVNLAGINFYLDEDAYFRLDQYLNQLKAYFKGETAAAEIISDIENRMAELFQQRIKNPQTVITLIQVEEIITILGKPGDFDKETTSEENKNSYFTKKKLYRDMDNSILGGICSGLGAYFNIDPTWVRIIFLIAILSGVSLLVYVIMWIIIPPARTTAEHLEMQGNPVNINNIAKAIRDEMDNLKTKFNDLSEQAKNAFKRNK